MATLTPSQLYAINRQAGFDPASAVIMTAIQLGESGGKTDVLGDEGLVTAKWGPSVGISQVRSLRGELGTGGTRDQMRLTDPLFNARAAFKISGGGKNWTDWTVWNDRNKPDSSWAVNLAKAKAAAAAGDGASLPPGLIAGDVQNTGLFGLPNPVDVVKKLSIEALFVTLGLVLVAAGASRALQLRSRVEQIQTKTRELVGV